MRKRIIICGSLLIAGLWLLKPWWTERKTPLQTPVGSSTPTAIPETVVAVKTGGDEESEPVEVIDLTQLQLPRTDPVPLPELPPEFLAALEVKLHAEEDPPRPMPVVPEFLPLAADRDEALPVSAATAPISRNMVAAFQFLCGLWKRTDSIGPSYPPVMPRQSPYHNDHPECPYVGERLDESSHARLKVKPHVEEAQDAPVKRNPMKREAKDVGPGDRPVGWFWKPF